VELPVITLFTELLLAQIDDGFAVRSVGLNDAL
jgi:hypothetical protein